MGTDFFTCCSKVLTISPENFHLPFPAFMLSPEFVDFSFEDLELTKSQRYQSKLKWEEAKRRTEREQRSSQKDRGRGMRR